MIDLPAIVARWISSLILDSPTVPWRPEEKQKFPDHIRPLLRKVGEAAYQADLFPVTPEDKQGNELFDMLPGVLPYNRFTLSVRLPIRLNGNTRRRPSC